MIVYTGDDAKYDNKETKRYDGMYYAIILNSTPAGDDINYICYVYIPEIYTNANVKNGVLYYRCFDYPRVLVPIKSDSCGSEEVPKIGQIIKVAFDDGNINCCRYIMSIPIDSLYEKMNYNFVMRGIIPTDTLPEINDEAVLETFRKFIPIGNYITTGYDEPPASCYKFKFLWSNLDSEYNELGAFKNWFIEALTMPLYSMGGKNAGVGTATVLPYFSTNIYSLLYVIHKIFSNTDNKDSIEQLSNLYTHMPTDENLGDYYEFRPYLVMFDPNKSKIPDAVDRAKVASVWLLGLYSGWPHSYNGKDDGYDDSDINYEVALANMAFPELTAEHLYPYLDGYNILSGPITTNTVPETVWLTSSYNDELYNYNENTKQFEKYRFHYLFDRTNPKMADNIAVYETHYVSVLASWFTAINSNITTDENMQNVILMCLTIAPWFAAPLLLYSLSNVETIKAMNKFINSLGDNDYGLEDWWNEYVINVNNTSNMEYTTIFPNQEAYEKFRESLQDLIDANDAKGFVDKFQEYTNQYLSGYYVTYDDFDEMACAAKQIDEKFNRLRERLKIQ